jgi:predicted enzyme related to lactoylglutathione lyase
LPKRVTRLEWFGGTLVEIRTIGAVLPTEDLARAKAFYTEKIGLDGQDVAAGVRFSNGSLFIYQAGAKSPGSFTQAGIEVADVKAAVDEMRSRGVVFEEYDMPGLKTENGLANTPDGAQAAWFKDTEGNVVSVVQRPE